MIVKSTKNASLDKSPATRKSSNSKPGKSIDPKDRKNVNVFNFMSVGQSAEQKHAKVIEVNRISFGAREKSAGAPVQRESKFTTVKRISRNSIVFPFSKSKSRAKEKEKSNQSSTVNFHIGKLEEQKQLSQKDLNNILISKGSNEPSGT